MSVCVKRFLLSGLSRSGVNEFSTGLARPLMKLVVVDRKKPLSHWTKKPH